MDGSYWRVDIYYSLYYHYVDCLSGLETVLMKLWKQSVLIIIILILLVLCAVKISKASGEGSFTITATNIATTSKIISTFVDSNVPDFPYYMQEMFIGYYSSSTYASFFKFITLIDTLRIIGPTKQIDSAMVRFCVRAAPSADDSQYVAIYEVIRPWVNTMTAADTSGVTWDSANATGDGSGGGTPDAWGTAGCKNTTTDRNASAEKVGAHDTLVLMDASTAEATDTVTFWISGTSIVDTIGSRNQGYMMRALQYGNNDGAASRSILNSSYAGELSVLTVWYSDKPAGETTATRRRRALIQQ